MLTPPPKRSLRSPDLLLGLAVFLFGAALAGGLLFFWPRPEVKYDAVEYVRLGQSLASGLGYRYGLDSYPTAYRPPLYPFVLAAFFALGGGALDAAYAAQALLHGAVAAATFALARQALPRLDAVAAAALAALSVGLTALAGFLMTETAQTALTTAALAATLWWLRAFGRRRAAVAGLLWGLAVLGKGTNAAFPVLLLIPLFAGWRSDLRRWAPGYAVLWLALLLTVLPWTVRNGLLFGRPVFVSTNVGIQWYISTLDPITYDVADPRLKVVLDEARARNLNEADTDRLFLTHALGRVLAEPGGYLRRSAANAFSLYGLPPRDAVEYLKPTVLYNDLPEYQWVIRLHHVLLWAAAFGLALAALRGQRELLAMWIVPLGTALIYAPFWVIPRFIAPALPVLFITSVAGLRLAAGNLPDAEKRPWRRAFPAALLALWVAASAAVFWGAHRPGWVVESAHPYPNSADLVWAIVNPDDAAATTRMRFGRVQLAGPGDRLIVLDSAFQVLDELRPEQFANGGWTASYPGRLLVLKLLTDAQGTAWGFSVDGVASGPP